MAVSNRNGLKNKLLFTRGPFTPVAFDTNYALFNRMYIIVNGNRFDEQMGVASGLWLEQVNAE